MTDYELYKVSSFGTSLTEPLFNELSEKENCVIFREDYGTAFLNGNKLFFLSVLPKCRNKGIGTRLLERCEEYVSEKGGEYIYVNGIFNGAPEESIGFFEKNGYEIKGNFVEMGMDVNGFCADRTHAPDNTCYRFFDGDHSELLQAVGEVDEEWAQYFTDDSKVFCGFKDGELASFCIVDEDIHCLLSDGNNKVGSIGCVGTRPSFRKKGIGLYMVELATEYLAEKDCDKSFIHCTHLEKWYGKLGYKTFLKYSAARKSVRR